MSELVINEPKIKVEVVDQIVNIDQVETTLDLKVQNNSVVFREDLVGSPGPIGPQGPQGVPGPTGPTGSSAVYIHTQGVPSGAWTINHGLNTYPGVTTVDSADSVVEGDINYVSTNTVVVTFAGSFGGKAFLVY